MSDQAPLGNGSLYEQISNNFFSNLTNAYPLHGQNPGVNLTTFNKQSFQLNFNGSDGTNFQYTAPLLLSLLNPNARAVLVSCAYPLSGQYDHLTRILFYVALVASILFRHQPVIASTALGSVMTYSTLSAIHLFVLLGKYKFKWPADWFLGSDISGWNLDTSTRGGDIDYFGIVPIIATTGIMLTPILTWSTTFRSDKAKALVVYWAIFIFAAMIPFYKLELEWQVSWDVNQIYSFAFCVGAGERCKFPDGFIPTWSDYNACSCVDFCALQNPPAPMRTGASMVPLLPRQASVDIIYKKGTAGMLSDKVNATYKYLGILVVILWGVAIIQGIIALIHSQFHISTTRSIIFRVLYSPRRSFVNLVFRGNKRERLLNGLHENPRFFRQARLAFAKSMAAFYYLVVVLGSIFVSPILFILTIFYCEVIIGTTSGSEHSDAIGAWAPWVAAALIVIAAAVVEYHSRCVGHISGAVQTPLNYIRYSDMDRPDTSKEKVAVSSQSTPAFRGLSSHIAYKLRLRAWSIRDELKHFWDWWRDPERYSPIGEESTGDSRYELLPGKPKCNCARCESKQAYDDSFPGPSVGVERSQVIVYSKNDRRDNRDWS